MFYILNNNLTNIPELQYYSQQNVKFLIPSKKCKSSSPKTLFFISRLKNDITSINSTYKIINYKNNKDSFMTYYMDDEEYFQFEELLSKNGLIRSHTINGDHNLYITRRIMELIKNNKMPTKINNLKKYYTLFDNQAFRKNKLYTNFNFMSETFIFPEDKLKIEKRFKNYKLDLKDLWLVKPANKFGGKGIEILKSLNDIKIKNFLITKYITNLDLINSKKYDLRLHVLISGLKPLRIYLNQEGIIRIASHNFSITKALLKDKFIHLTNSVLNTKSREFIFPNNTNQENANMWDLKTYKKHLNKKGVDFNILLEKIKDMVIKSIICVYHNLITKLNKSNLTDNNFYNVLGYDIIITNEYNPMLLEINTAPAMHNYTSIDESMKINLFVDTLNLIGISSFSKNMVFDYKKKYNYEMNSEEAVDNALCELTRPRGGYDLIFPLKSNINIYKKYFKDNIEENELFWKKIR